MSWIFRTVAAGLLCAPDQRTVLKTKENCGRMLDESGVPFASPQNQNSAAVWRTHHAFSARCDYEEKEKKNANGHEHNTTAALSNNNTHRKEEEVLSSSSLSWSMAFLLRATASKPCILLSAAPEYYPLRGPDQTPNDANDNNIGSDPAMVESVESYDARTLGTPILWEEPFVFSVECSAAGASLWSGEAEWHGQRVLANSSVFHEKHAASESERVVEGLVCISWEEHQENASAHATSATMTVTVGTQAALEEYNNNNNNKTHLSQTKGPLGTGGTSVLEWMRADAERRVAADVSKTIDLTNLDRRGCVRFLPHVTLLDAGDSATILNGSESHT